MPVMRRFAFGEITSVTMSDGKQYDSDDFRLSNVNKPGLVIFYESFNRCPGQYFLYLYLYCDDLIQTYFHSSCGDLAVDDRKYTLKTRQSIYKIVEDPMLLTADEKMDVLLNSNSILSMNEAMAEVAESELDKTRSQYSVYISRMTRNLPKTLLSAVFNLYNDGDVQKVSEEIDTALSNGSISPDQARYLNNKYVNFSRTGRNYYI